MSEVIRKIEALVECNNNKRICRDCEFSKKVPCVPRACTLDETEVLEATIKELKDQKETIQITKKVAERYANILADKGVNGVWVRYAVKKGKQFMLRYQNKKASWCYGLDGAWMTFDRKMADGFAKLTNGKVIEVTLAERPVNLDG